MFKTLAARQTVPIALAATLAPSSANPFAISFRSGSMCPACLKLEKRFPSTAISHGIDNKAMRETPPAPQRSAEWKVSEGTKKAQVVATSTLEKVKQVMKFK